MPLKIQRRDHETDYYFGRNTGLGAWGAQVGRLTRQKGNLPSSANVELADAEDIPQNADDFATNFNF